jgi:hypothetical protein
MEADPIFAAIKKHRRACMAYRAASQAAALMGDEAGRLTPAVSAAEDETERMMNLEGDALLELLNCEPTTLAGIAAVLNHLDKPASLNEENDDTVLSDVLANIVSGA